ncbi:MAG TPA: O-antigen ligase family protein [Baekduia sp.]|nr:O-antigen ligase family protein [Baekduia sp.]
MAALASVRAPRPRIPAAVVPILVVLALLCVSVVHGGGRAAPLSGALIVVSVLAVGHRRLLSWPSMVTLLLGVILFIPINRYDLPVRVPFASEPYRATVLLILAAWGTSLVVDRRVTARPLGIERQLKLIVGVVLLSELANPGRLADTGSYVLKALTFFATFVLVVYFLGSVVRDRAAIDRVLRMLVGGGAVVAGAAVLERQSQFNVFDQLHSVLPILQFHPVEQEVRNGAVRAVASAGHPIELATVLAVLFPLAIYLVATTSQRRWWAAAGLILLGNFATGSRTGFIALTAVLVVFLWLRPRDVCRCWPALLPTLVLLHVFVPGAIGGVTGSLFGGNLIAEQSHQVKGNARLANNRIADWGPSLSEYASHNPLVGEGFGTRVTGFGNPDGNAAILDNQWLKSLLETGLLGIAGWFWLLGGSIRRLGREAKRRRGSPDGWLPTALAGAIAGFAVAMFTYDAFSFYMGTFLLYVLVALAAVTLIELRRPAEARA